MVAEHDDDSTCTLPRRAPRLKWQNSNTKCMIRFLQALQLWHQPVQSRHILLPLLLDQYFGVQHYFYAGQYLSVIGSVNHWLVLERWSAFTYEAPSEGSKHESQELLPVGICRGGYNARRWGGKEAGWCIGGEREVGWGKKEKSGWPSVGAGEHNWHMIPKQVLRCDCFVRLRFSVIWLFMQGIFVWVLKYFYLSDLLQKLAVWSWAVILAVAPTQRRRLTCILRLSETCTRRWDLLTAVVNLYPSVKLSRQVLRPRLSPPRLVVCPPPSPRLLNVLGVEESDFRDSSTLCLWSLDPRWSGAEEGQISVEVIFEDFGILKLKAHIHRSTVKVIKHQKLIQVRRYFWLVSPNCQHQQLQLASPAVATFQEGAPSPRPPVLSVAFNSFNLWTKWRSWHMERKVFPVREYLFMTTRNRRQDFIVPYANLPTVSIKPCTMPLSSIHV